MAEQIVEPKSAAGGAADGTGAAGRVGAAYWALTKPRIVSLVLVTTLTTLWLAPVAVPFWRALWIVLGTALAAASASALNQYLDRDIDALMHRTRKRPLPAGAVPPQHALRFGLAVGLLSFFVLWQGANLLAALIGLGGIVYYVVIYTWWLKRSTPQNIVIGGGAGAVGPLIAWAGATGRVELPAVVLFAIIFLWTPPHFWALALYRRDDYAQAQVPMMPVVAGVASTKRQIFGYTVVLVACSLLLYPLRVSGVVYLSVAVVLGLGYLILAALHLRDDTDRVSRVLFRYSLLYLGLLFVAMSLDRHP